MEQKKNREVEAATGGGIGLAGALLLLFIALKLTHVINWTWGWVLSPLWIAPAAVIAILLVYLIAALIVTAVKNRKNRKAGR